MTPIQMFAQKSGKLTMKLSSSVRNSLYAHRDCDMESCEKAQSLALAVAVENQLDIMKEAVMAFDVGKDDVFDVAMDNIRAYLGFKLTDEDA